MDNTEIDVITVENDMKEVSVDKDETLNKKYVKPFEVDSEEIPSYCNESEDLYSSLHVENVNLPDDDCGVDVISEIVDVVSEEKNTNKDINTNCLEDNDCFSQNINNVNYTEKNNDNEDTEKLVDCFVNQIQGEMEQASKIAIPYCDHGYCKIPSVESGKLIELKKSTIVQDITQTILKNKKNQKQEQLNDEEAPITKKIKINLGTSQQHIPVGSDNQKQRMDPCPPLTKEHIDLLLSYLANPKLCVTEQLFLMQLKLSNFPRIKRYSVARQLERWSKCLMKRKINGQVTLCLRVSEKIILPMEKYATIIRDAHENIGYFLSDKETRKEKGRKCDHNSYHKTFTLIESEYGVGGREFGMSKYRIYEHVANCRDCTTHQKRLPSLSKVLGSNEVPKNMVSLGTRRFGDGLFEEGMSVVNNSTEVSNDNGMGDDTDAPISMIWEKPSPGSIWHNQQGLASEVNPYSKLLGVIQEVGLDLIASVQGDVPSKSKFLTKLYCATRLIQEMRAVCERSETNADTQFMIDYLKLQDTYVEIGQLDLFLYDVNLLAIKYNLTKSELFMHIVNNCVSKFNKMNKPIAEQSLFDTPIDLIGIDTT